MSKRGREQEKAKRRKRLDTPQKRFKETAKYLKPGPKPKTYRASEPSGQQSAVYQAEPVLALRNPSLVSLVVQDLNTLDVIVFTSQPLGSNMIEGRNLRARIGTAYGQNYVYFKLPAGIPSFELDRALGVPSQIIRRGDYYSVFLGQSLVRVAGEEGMYQEMARNQLSDMVPELRQRTSARPADDFWTRYRI